MTVYRIFNRFTIINLRPAEFFAPTACLKAPEHFKNSLRAEFDDSVCGDLAGRESEAFALGGQRRVAVKVIDDRGNELMAMREPEV